MAPNNPIVLILGAGPNIGKGVAYEFAMKGYTIVLASRTRHDDSPSTFIAGDFTNPGSVVDIFASCREQHGEPSVVIYNGKLAKVLWSPSYSR